MKYDKSLDIGFTVLTDKEEIATNDEIIRGLQRRIVILSENEGEIQEAVGEVDVADADETSLGRHNKILDDVNEKRQPLIDKVLEDMGREFNDSHPDLTAIEELIKHIPTSILKSFLPEA